MKINRQSRRESLLGKKTRISPSSESSDNNKIDGRDLTLPSSSVNMESIQKATNAEV